MSTPLRQLLEEALFDEPTRAAVAADPAGFLRSHGWEHLEGTELAEALAVVADSLPVPAAAAVTDATAAVTAELEVDADLDVSGFALAASTLAGVSGAVDPAVASIGLPSPVVEPDTTFDLDGSDDDPDIDLEIGTDTGIDLAEDPRFDEVEEEDDPGEADLDGPDDDPDDDFGRGAESAGAADLDDLASRVDTPTGQGDADASADHDDPGVGPAHDFTDVAGDHGLDLDLDLAEGGADGHDTDLDDPGPFDDGLDDGDGPQGVVGHLHDDHLHVDDLDPAVDTDLHHHDPIDPIDL